MCYKICVPRKRGGWSLRALRHLLSFMLFCTPHCTSAQGPGVYGWCPSTDATCTGKDLLCTCKGANTTCNHLDLLMSPAFSTGGSLTWDNLFPTEVSPVPTSAPVCPFYPFPFLPSQDLSPCHWVLICARCQALPFGSSRQQEVQEAGSSSCAVTGCACVNTLCAFRQLRIRAKVRLSL